MKREERIIEDYRKSGVLKKKNFWFRYRELRPAFDEIDENYLFAGPGEIKKGSAGAASSHIFKTVN